jgi:protein-S-isoprenylcysteine O-methyltransferase Ste14
MFYSPLLVFLSVLIYGLVHSLLASLWAKGRARHWMGTGVDRWYRLAYNLFATVSLLPVLALPALLSDQRLYSIPPPWIYLTLSGQFLAVLALVAGLLQTGVWSFLGLRQLVGSREEPSSLNVSGLYRHVRHPLYTAGLALIWLTPVMTFNLFALNLGLTVYLVLGAMLEERKLKREFGEEYTRYQVRTPMLIPRFPKKD